MARSTAQRACGCITLTDVGVVVRDAAGTETAVRWDQVRGIAAYKRDLFTVDEMWLAFRLHGTDEWVHVSEEDEGFDALLKEIERRCPDRNLDWWYQTAVPAFAHCWTIVWGDVPPVLRCQKCGYDLEHLQGTLRCPECGHQNDPDRCWGCGGVGRVPHDRNHDIVFWTLLIAVVGLGLGVFARVWIMVGVGDVAGGVAVVCGMCLPSQLVCAYCKGSGRRRVSEHLSS